MKKTVYLLTALALLSASGAYAMEREPGPYLGGQIGWGRIDAGDGYKKNVGDAGTEVGNFTAWRAYGGYNFNKVFSIEGGYTNLPENKYSKDSNTTKLKTYAIDLVAKITFPLEKLAKPLDHFSIYGKGGAAYVNTEIDISSSTKLTSTNIMPTYGAGIVFNFTDNIAVDASWTGIMGKNYTDSADKAGTNKPTPNCNMFTLGLSYKITGIF